MVCVLAQQILEWIFAAKDGLIHYCLTLVRLICQIQMSSMQLHFLSDASPWILLKTVDLVLSNRGRFDSSQHEILDKIPDMLLQVIKMRSAQSGTEVHGWTTLKGRMMKYK